MSQSFDPETGLPVSQQLREDLEITVRDASARTGDADFLMVDVREADELEVAPVPGVVHIPLGVLEERLDEIRDFIEDHPNGTVAILCRTGNRSLRATLALRAHGIASAVNVAGGTHAWSNVIDPAIPKY